MKIHLLSDLHIEFEDFNYEETNSDIVVLAGDIHVKEKGVKWAIKNIRNKPVIYVLGNHEYYKKAYPCLIDTLHNLCKGTNVHLLENDFINIDGVNILGCTLWTDFKLYGDPKVAGARCQDVMTDYKQIKILPRFKKISSTDISSIHSHSINWLEETLEKLQGQTNVIITHHGPSVSSVPTEFIGDIITSAFVSNLESTILKYNPNLWLHGHLHNSSSYNIGGCRIVCNPRGYPDELNTNFDSRLVVTLSK